MASWISLRTPSANGTVHVHAPIDAENTAALVRAARTVQRRPTQPSAKPHHSIYVVLLDLGSGQHGLYVGMTGLPPDDRYRNHKAGYKASKKVRDWGVGLLPALYRHLNPQDDASARLAEVELAEALRTVGLPVSQA